MGEQLNTAQLCREVGVDRITVVRWVKKGLPHLRQKGHKGGSPRCMFDKETALAWIAQNGSMTAGRKAAAVLSQIEEENAAAGSVTPEEKKPAAKPSASIDMDLARLPGLLGNLERLKAQEITTSGALLRAKSATPPNAALVSLLSDRHLAETKTLAKIEQDALNYRIRLGELAPRAEMIAAYERIMVGVKNAVLGIPSAVMPLIIPHLKDQNKAHDIMAILDKASRNALRNASKRST